MDNGASSYRRFLDGDEAAFDLIVREYREPLIFFISRYVHDTSAAEDIAIDVFMYILVHPKRYNFKVSLKTYLFMLGRSRAVDFLRRQKKLLPLEEAATAEEYISLENIILADQRKKAVNGAIAKLNTDMQAAVHLVYFEGLTYEETARVMKKSKKQVDNLLYRAKKELRTILGKEGEELL